MENESDIHKLLYHYFEYPHHFSNLKKTVNIDRLKSEEILIEEGEKLRLNFESDLLIKELLKILELSLNTSLPENISEVLKLIDEFDNFLSNKYIVGNNKMTYLNLIKSLKVYCLTFLSKNLEVYNFLIELLNKTEKRTKQLINFEEIYFRFLLKSNYDVETIYSSCTEVYLKNKNQSRYIFTYLKNLVKDKLILSKDIYNYGLENNIHQYPGLAPCLLAELYNESNTEAFEYSTQLFLADQSEAFKSFASFDLRSLNEIEKVFYFIKDVDSKTTSETDHKTFLLCKLIENNKTSSEIRDKCFQIILNLLKSENVDIANVTFRNIQYSLENYEERRYGLLHVYLTYTKNIHVLKDFFYNFKDPKYLFDMILIEYNVNGLRKSNNIFDQIISHFWSEKRNDMETSIEDMFNYRKYSLLAIKIMLSNSHDYPYPINFLKLKTEEAQKNAIDAICIYPHSIDKLISSLLKLKESEFKSVRTHLENKLSSLILETYHESLYELIIPVLNSSKDKKLISSLKKALSDYNNLKIIKSKVKDLNPWENEKNLLDLYYRLEHENRAKMNKDFKEEDSFLPFKSMIIIRGKAWKLEDREDVYPLQTFQSSMLVDSRAYKNPNLYEQELENF
ncbi:hypothetical protein AR687_10795 [Flavobacteriaceae bacterium CRH]|nr:hypothetical protein AR687_10795 [Flavobacteriaceae bacterium CRH]